MATHPTGSQHTPWRQQTRRGDKSSSDFAKLLQFTPPICLISRAIGIA
jgi:hypothetical protein